MIVFFSTSPDLSGHILDASGKPIFSIMEEGEGKVREIAMGTDGACARPLPTLNSLIADLTEL